MNFYYAGLNSLNGGDNSDIVSFQSILLHIFEDLYVCENMCACILSGTGRV